MHIPILDMEFILKEHVYSTHLLNWRLRLPKLCSSSLSINKLTLNTTFIMVFMQPYTQSLATLLHK